MINFRGFFYLFKKDNNKEIKLVNVFLTQVILIVLLMFIIVLYLWVQREYKQLKNEISSIQQDYLKSQKENIRKETERAVNYINYNIRKTDSELRKELILRVENGYNLALNIYNKYKNQKSIGEIKKIIVDALYDVKLGDSQSCYVIGDLDGKIILLPDIPDYEGKNLYNLRDQLGNYVIRDLINVSKNNQEGFVTNYWSRSDGDSVLGSRKLFYVKLVEPLGWFIGTDEFIEDFNAAVQHNVLEWLANYRFGDEGYIFVNTYEGDALLLNGELVVGEKNIWDIEDPNGIKVVQEERKAVKNPNGSYIYYSWRKLTSNDIGQKMSFVKGVPEWNWMVGAGVYIEEINEVLDVKRAELKKVIYKDIFFIIIWLSILFVFIYLFTIYLSKKTQKNKPQLYLFLFKILNKSNKRCLLKRTSLYSYILLVITLNTGNFLQKLFHRANDQP